MKSYVKTLLIIAVALILAGGGIFVWAMNSLNWDFASLSNIEYETNTYEIEDDFVSLSFDVNTANVKIGPSADGKCSVVFREYEDERHTASVQGDTLVIAAEKKDHIGVFGFFPESLSATVYLPEREYRSLKIESDTGDIDIPSGFSFESADIDTDTGDVYFNAYVSGRVGVSTDTGDIDITGMTAGELKIDTDTGDIFADGLSVSGGVEAETETGRTKLSGLACKSFELKGGTGETELANVVAEGRFDVSCSTGDIRLDNCDASELRLESDTGDITGSLRSAKIFIVDRGTGDVDVPKTSTGGKCEIGSKTGDVRIVVSS